MTAKFGLGFCDWATRIGQHTGYDAQKNRLCFH